MLSDLESKPPLFLPAYIDSLPCNCQLSVAYLLRVTNPPQMTRRATHWTKSCPNIAHTAKLIERWKNILCIWKLYISFSVAFTSYYLNHFMSLTWNTKHEKDNFCSFVISDLNIKKSVAKITDWCLIIFQDSLHYPQLTMLNGMFNSNMWSLTSITQCHLPPHLMRNTYKWWCWGRLECLDIQCSAWYQPSSSFLYETFSLLINTCYLFINHSS